MEVTENIEVGAGVMDVSYLKMEGDSAIPFVNVINTMFRGIRLLPDSWVEVNLRYVGGFSAKGSVSSVRFSNGPGPALYDLYLHTTQEVGTRTKRVLEKVVLTLQVPDVLPRFDRPEVL